MKPCRNLGFADRAVRTLAGSSALLVAVVALDLAEGSPEGIAVAAIGVVLLLTAALGMCPLYLPFGLSTCRTPPP